MNSKGGRVQSFGSASTTSMCERRSIGLRPVFRPRRRTTRFPFRGAFSITTTSSLGKPAARITLAIASAAVTVLPTLFVVLTSTSSLRSARAWSSQRERVRTGLGSDGSREREGERDERRGERKAEGAAHR